MREFNSLLDYIVQPSHTSYVYNGWNNGAIGTIADYTGRCIYRFHEHYYDDKGIIHAKLQEEEDAPILAVGIVAYWLHYRKTPNKRASFGVKHKSISEIFKDYTAGILYLYKNDREQDPSSWRNDLERDFYTHYIIPNEKRLIKKSEALFEYITPQDQLLVRNVMKEYIEYLQDIRKKYESIAVKPKTKKKIKEIRVVDIDGILCHLNRDLDKNSISDILRALLEEHQSEKELARVALLIYESRYFISRDYSTFANWYKDFCRFVGCNFHKCYEPSKLKPISEEIKNKYYFF